MARLGIVGALLIEKTAVGLACGLVALLMGPAIHRNDPWVWKVPMTPWVRRWMRRGDRSWTALIPLYGMVAAQALAAAAWLWLG